jgi:hypothetical protein
MLIRSSTCHPTDHGACAARTWQLLLESAPWRQIGCTILDDLRRLLPVGHWLCPRCQSGSHSDQLSHLLFESECLGVPCSEACVQSNSPTGRCAFLSDMHGRQALDSTHLEAAVVNTFSGPFARQRGVDRILPSRPQPGHRIRRTTASTGDGVKPLRFLAEHAFRINCARSHEEMRMMVPIVAITRRCVQRAIHANAEFVGNFSGKAKRQRGALISIKFSGKRQHDLPREDGIAPTVVHFDAVPELLSVVHAPTAWQLNARIEHPVSAAVIEDQAGALIADQRAGPICGSGRRGATAGASDGCACAQMKNSHLQFLRGVGAQP